MTVFTAWPTGVLRFEEKETFFFHLNKSMLQFFIHAPEHSTVLCTTTAVLLHPQNTKQNLIDYSCYLFLHFIFREVKHIFVANIFKTRPFIKNGWDALLQVISSHKNSDEANLILKRKESSVLLDVSLERLCFSQLTSQSVDLLDVFYVHRLVFLFHPKRISSSMDHE